MFDRVSQQRRVAQTSMEVFPAPSKGWVQSGNVLAAGKDQAEVLDNFIPTAQGAELRGGSTVYADLGSSVKTLMVYSSAADDVFGATDTALFDVDRVAAGANDYAEVEGLSSADWSGAQISTSGGEFLVAVNGADHAVYWDGSGFEPIVAAAVNDVGFDAESAAFAVGQTVTGGTSGATATILAITKTSATAGVLKVGAITSGPYQDNEALTDGATGAATADGASASGSAVAITNILTAALSQVWSFKERLFFVEGGTQSAWYLPVKQIGGAAVELPLGSVFKRGGKLLFGATWSLDSGSGLDDVCIFVSTNGEIAVYEGTDPASASTWALVGVYDIGKPIDKHAFFKAGGDLAILTDDGIIAVSEALRKDRAALQASAISYPIEDAWKEAIANRSTSYPIRATLWQSQTLLLVGTPLTAGGKRVSFIANARTGAWARVTGWDVRCSAVGNNQLYFGNDAGKVMKANSGGADDGVQYTGIYVPKFSECKTDAFKAALHCGITYRANAKLRFKVAAHSDYNVRDITAPVPANVPSGDVWGTGVWGTFTWGSAAGTVTFTEWDGVSAGGYSLASGVYITSNQASRVVFQILATRLRYERGYAL